MAHLLRALIFFMLLGITLTMLSAFGVVPTSLGHIRLAIPAFLFVIFVQAFVMFFFIGSARLVKNILIILSRKDQLEELFETPPQDLSPYLKKVSQMDHQATLCKRQTVPWSILMIILGSMAFLLGGAHDTGMVSKKIHVGLVYGFTAALLIGVVKQWIYLGRCHRLLREIKELFHIPDASM